MNYNEIKEILETYVFEYIERIARFYQHLDEVEQQFYFEEDINLRKIDDSKIFIDSYKACLNKLLYIAIGFNNALEKDTEESELKELILQIKENLALLNKIHTDLLIHLPRPKAPIELQRFSRIIDKQIDNAPNKLNHNQGHIDKDDDYERKISIFISEKTSEETYAPDSLSEFKTKDMNEKIREFNKYSTQLNIPVLDEFKPKLDYPTYHICIPRIDANNPCRWPTLIHELAHHIEKRYYNSRKEIYEDFKGNLNENEKNILSSIENNNSLQVLSWLKECWCDLLATFIIGPAFWFSQFSSFIMNDKSINSSNTHPPALFRLKLIRRIIEHRIFDSINFETSVNQINTMEKLIKHFDIQNDEGFEKCYDIRQLYIFFRSYFFSKFFQQNNKNVTETLKPLVKHTFKIKNEIIKKHISDIEKGRPIPSKPKDKNSFIVEEPASIQDIILAAWLFRRTSLKSKILNNLKVNTDLNDEEKIENYFKKYILSEFNRFDEIVLRSIQVSEWFDLYDPFVDPVTLTENKVDELIKNYENKKADNSEFKLLTDTHIYNLLKSDELKIIPIINLIDQLGTSSFDIRLGTSFQLYFPNKTGIVDFTNNESKENYNYSSKLYDLDFIESITIAPQQFMLGHSMEFIELPDTIAAEVEGRSSFARFGIEVHATAGFIDPGFRGVITFELFNSGPNPVKLFPGLRIAQLRFFKVEEPTIKYNVRETTKYKGLLAHSISLQFKDMEMKRLALTKK